MAESKVKDDNFFLVSGWMLNRLELKGAALQVFAIIYGFSQDGESYFTGSLQYLSDFTNTSKPTIIKALKELADRGYILKYENEMNGVKFNKYKANLLVVKNLAYPSKETLQGGSQISLPEGSKETLPNNISLDNKNNISKDKKKESKSFDAIIDRYLYPDGQSVRFEDHDKRRELLQEWLKVRKAKRAAMTDSAIQMNIDKLDKLAHESRMSVVEYLSEVICRGWAAFYVINNYNRPQKPQPQQNKRTGNVFLSMLDDEM
jgi:DNA-binding Lrp family transcriptional regulator